MENNKSSSVDVSMAVTENDLAKSVQEAIGVLKNTLEDFIDVFSCLDANA